MRAVNSYILFCLENRDRVKTQNPGVSNSDITAALGAIWRDMDQVEKDDYKARSLEIKEVRILLPFSLSHTITEQEATP